MIYSINVEISDFIEPIKLLCEFILLPILVIFLYDFFNFLKFFYNLCDEIDENYSKMQNVKLNEQFTRMRNIWNKDVENPHQFEWIGFAKIISIWTLAEKNDTVATDYYRYLPSNELKNFIRRGYYPYIKQIEESLTLFYLYCEDFSISEQNIEKIIHNDFTSTDLNSQPLVVKNAYFDNKMTAIQVITNSYQPSIFLKYNEIHPFFKKGIFWVIILYVSESLLMKTLRRIAMNCRISSFYQNWIRPNKWIVLNSIAIIVFILGIWLTTWWANVDSIHTVLESISFQFFSYAFVISFVALPLVIMYRILNQEWRTGIRFTASTSLFFLLMLISYGVVNTYFSTAPQFMREATTSFISAFVGGFIALMLDALMRPRQQ